MGVKIRTMWMTPFYLFFGVLVIYIFQSQINLNKLKGFTAAFIILFVFSPFAYAYVSITQTDKRTDYNGKEMANNIEIEWNKNFKNKIKFVIGNEWFAGNLSYHLSSRPMWTSFDETSEIDYDGGILIIGHEFSMCEESDSGIVKQICFNSDPPSTMIGEVKD